MSEFPSYKMQQSADGVAVVTFDRPPVNAMATATYVELGKFSAAVDNDDQIRAVVLRAPDANKAWCAGADLKQLVDMSGEDRAARYQTINGALMQFYSCSKPIVGALNGNCIGMGMVLASLCDIRVAADDATFTLPEVERGMAAPIGVFLTRLGVPGGFGREMLFTGARFTAREMAWTGFSNYVLPRSEVTAKAVEIAQRIAKHRATAIAASKAIANKAETIDWASNYKIGQEFSVGLAKAPDARKEIREFLNRKTKA